jgi:hypothetical protein
MRRFRHQRDEIPERVVRRRGLGNLIVRLRLDGMDKIAKPEIKELCSKLKKYADTEKGITAAPRDFAERARKWRRLIGRTALRVFGECSFCIYQREIRVGIARSRFVLSAFLFFHNRGAALLLLSAA